MTDPKASATPAPSCRGRLTQRTGMTTTAALGLALLTALCSSQTVAPAQGGASLLHPLPTKQQPRTQLNAVRSTLKENPMNTTLTQPDTRQCDTTPAVEAIRPFHVHFSQGALDDLRQRLAATRWPDQETVTDPSQGVKLATMKALVHYWQTAYDCRKVEARLNA